MHLPTLSCLLGAGLMAVVGCARDLRFDTQTVAEFVAPYEDMANRADGAPASLPSGAVPHHQRALVQLAVPDDDHSIRVWYAWRSPDGSPPLVTVTLDGVVVPEAGNGTHITEHVVQSTYRTGVITISSVDRSIPHTLLVSGVDPEESFTLTCLPTTTSATSTRFLVSSCFQPFRYAKPYHIVASTAAVLRAMAARANDPSGAKPDFMIGLGDQIYVDPGADTWCDKELALLYGSRSDTMRTSQDQTDAALSALYRLHLGLRPLNAALQGTPMLMMWDDHDIRDGWGSQGDERLPAWQDYYAKARAGFEAYQAARNPGFAAVRSSTWISRLDAALPQTKAGNGLYTMRVERGPVRLYVFDGRSARTYDDEKPTELTGMGDAQMADFHKWMAQLDTTQSLVLVVAVPVPVLLTPGLLPEKAARSWLSINDDARDRILASERDAILGALVRHVEHVPTHRFVLLAGDVHYSGLNLLFRGTSEPASDAEPVGVEVISSGLAQTEFALGYRSPANLNEVAGPTTINGASYFGQQRGALPVPCFAEIQVDVLDPAQAPRVRVILHPGVDMADMRLASTYDANASATRAAEPQQFPPNRRGSRPTITGNWSNWSQIDVFLRSVLQYPADRPVHGPNAMDPVSGW